jgi:hypothetical protein
MKTVLRIFLILILVSVVAIAGVLYKYPFMAPWYRDKYPAEDYFALIETTAKPTSAQQMMQAFEQMYPYWIGTHWNFNGISETPGDGSIACGYFVTTMIRDMHYPINRVKLAQCASEEMIQALVDENNIRRYNLVENALMFEKVRAQGENLYIIGLDNHTGFIYNDGENIYFIHSSGAFPYRVIKTNAETCNTITSSKYKVIGCLTTSAKMFP